jgi:hypothetical protein
LTFFFSGIDLALLAQANHSILTYGTFGMWGALLAGLQLKCSYVLKAGTFD